MATSLSAICKAPKELVAKVISVPNAADLTMASFPDPRLAHRGGSHRNEETQSIKVAATASGLRASARPLDKSVAEDGMGPMLSGVTDVRKRDIMASQSASGCFGESIVRTKSNSIVLQNPT
jgi:hypothetical protein